MSLARLAAVLAVAAAGGLAFLSSAGMLALGLDSMPLRYGLAGAIGYLLFLGWLRLLVALRRDPPDPNSSPLEGADVLPTRPDAVGDSSPFAGGRSGGGGGGASWSDSTQVPGDSTGADIGLDLDEGWPIGLALLVLGGAVIGAAYVVWTAPFLLAEIALDVALVGAIARRLPKDSAPYWMFSALRRTWLPAAMMCLSLIALGVTFSWLDPSAQSIGDVFTR
jgi:hypothetical protein